VQASAQKPIRACMISFYFPPDYSGSALQALALCKELEKIGVETTVVAANLIDAAREECVEGISVTRLDVSKKRELQIPFFWFSLARYLWTNRRSYDVIHAHGTIQHSVVGLIGRLLHKPTFLKIAMANSDIAFQRQGRLWGSLQRFLVAKFDRYIATSSQIKAELLASDLGDEGSILAIPNGVDTHRFGTFVSAEEKMRRKLDLSLPTDPLVLFVGIIAARKNVDTVLRTWARAKQRGCRGHLIVVGPLPNSNDDPEYEYFQGLLAYVTRHELSSSVSFLGFRADPTPYFRAADIFFFPSRREGMPNAVLEGMASGLPCIVANFSGASDLVSQNETGFIADADAVDDFARALEGLLVSAEAMETMGRKAWGLANSKFSLQVVAGCIKAAYAAALEK
jgi:glycosyltransferase involved in cell wall biosynthesis